MDVLMDGLLMAATVFAGGYCWVLARRVRDLKSLDKGLGGAIVTLTRQIELARGTLDEAKASAKEAHVDLSDLIARAGSASGQLKLSLAAARLAGTEPVEAASPDRDAAPAPEAHRSSSAPFATPTPAVAEDPSPRPGLHKLADIASLFAEEAADEVPERQASRAEAHQPVGGPPKPRALPPIANPLRRREPIAPARSEDELMDFLTAVAAGGAR